LPSSLFLARALAAELRKPRPPARILEVGPGTGPVTAQLIRHLKPEDQLDAVECNGHFVALLQRRFDQDRRFRVHRHQVQLIHGGVGELEAKAIYDYIVAALPSNTSRAARVREFSQVYNRLLKPGGTLSYFEYVLIRQLKTPFVNRTERRRLFRVG